MAAFLQPWIERTGTSEKKNEPVYGETSRYFCYIDNAVQANLLAATTENLNAVNQIYNVAVGERTTLNELYAQLLLRFAHLQDAQPSYRDFRAGDVRHS